MAVVVRRASDGVLQIYKNQLSVAPAGGAEWGARDLVASLNSNSSAMDVVAFGIGASASGTFFLAYNGLVSSGVVMIPNVGAPKYIEFQGRRMNAAAFLPSGSDAQIYAVFDKSPQQVRTMKWSSYMSEVDELFIPPSAISVKKLIISQTSATGVAFIAHGGSEVLVADNVQRTFTPIQGMPLESRPDLIGNAAGALLASSGGSIFLLDAMQCSAGYWDGASCQQHVCARARPCAANEVWDPARTRCVCRAGYATSAGQCGICPINYYCNNGNKTLCSDGKTSEQGASAASECTCKDGQYLNGDKCEACRAGYFCPNRVNILPCPGKAQSQVIGSNSPRSCECDAGADGPACEPCAGTAYCPRSTRVAVNYALTATVRGVRSAAVCDTLGDVLRGYISVDTAAQARVWCQYYDEGSIVAIMIQSDISSSTFRAIPMLLKRNSTLARINASFIMERFTPPGDSAAVADAVKVTEPTPCPVGQKPSPDYTRCICDAGYSSNDGGIVQTYCTACQENFFSTDGVACVACPRGQLSAKAAATCSSAHRATPAHRATIGALLLVFVSSYFKRSHQLD